MLARLVSNSWPGDPPTSASQSAGITGVSHCARLSPDVLKQEARDPVPHPFERHSLHKDGPAQAWHPFLEKPGVVTWATATGPSDLPEPESQAWTRTLPPSREHSIQGCNPC